MTLEIITSVMRIVIIIMTGILLPMIRRWISNRTEYDKYNRIKEWAYTAVWAAEQIHNKAEHDDPEGTLRRKYAKEAIKCMADKCGLELSESEINVFLTNRRLRNVYKVFSRINNGEGNR